METRLRMAMLNSDIEALDRLIDDRLLFVGPDGGIYSKQDDLELHRTGATRITRIDVHDMSLEAHASTVVATVVAAMAGSFKGQAFAGRCRYLRVWLQCAQGWRIVGGSVCALAD
jgi:hypothetical protein